jgi:predicted metal-dependent peptidase
VAAELGSACPREDGGVLEEIRVLREQWTGRIADALEVARVKGNLPRKLEEAVLELLQPKVPWAHKLVMLAKDGRRRSRHSYEKISRRNQAICDDFVFPGETTRGLNLALAIDTSASVSSDELQRAVSAGAGILKVLNAKIRYLACDSSDPHQRDDYGPEGAADYRSGRHKFYPRVRSAQEFEDQYFG